LRPNFHLKRSKINVTGSQKHLKMTQISCITHCDGSRCCRATCILYLLDVVAESFVEVLHVLAFLVARVLDCADAGRRHVGVLSLGERDLTAAARAGLHRARHGLAALLGAESRAAGARDDETVRRNGVRDVVRLRRRRALVRRLHVD